MKISYQALEEKYVVFSLLFFTNTIDFNSLYVSAEGADNLSAAAEFNPLAGILSLIQHSIFLTALFLLFCRRREAIKAISKNKFLIILILLFSLSFLWSSFPDFTLRRSISLMETTLFGIYLAASYTIKQQLKLLCQAFGMAMLVHVLFTITFPSHAIEAGKHAGALRGTLEHKNYFGRLMVLSSLIFGFTTPENKRQANLLKMLGGLSILLIVLSTSKTALVTLIFLLLLLVLYKSFHWDFRLATVLQLFSLLVVMCILEVLLISPESVEGALGRDLTLTGRTVIWTAVITKLAERPWLGYGYQGFWHGLDGPSADVIRMVGSTYKVPHSHNGFLELALAVGIVGVAIFGISLLLTFRRAFISARLSKSNDGLWFLIYASYLIIYNQTEATLVAHNSIFWILYVSVAMSKLSSKLDNEKLCTHSVDRFIEQT